MGRLTVADHRSIHFEHYAGIGPTVVLAHGWGMCTRAFDGLIAHLQDADPKRAVLAFDQRACGQSDKDFEDVSIEALAADLVALVDELRLDSVILNGWSLGGAVVVEAAAALGERLRGVVLTGGATPRYTQAEGFPWGGTPADVEATVAALRADRATFLRGLYGEGVFVRDVGQAVCDHAWQLAMQASSAADASLGALAHIDQREALANIAAPVLVITGSEDGVVPPDISRAAAETARDGRLHTMDGCGHAPFLEDAEQYNTLLDAFLQEVS